MYPCPVEPNAIFRIAPVLISIGFVVFVCFLVLHVLNKGMERNRNNRAPIISKDATIVAMRMAVQIHNHANGYGAAPPSAATKCFATFQFEDGSRIELKIPDKEYGLLADGDQGQLTFQGTRYKSFKRSALS